MNNQPQPIYTTRASEGVAQADLNAAVREARRFILAKAEEDAARRIAESQKATL